MASRSSGLYNSEFYDSTWRGRAADGDIGWEQFPEKTEHTEIFEDPFEVHDDQRLGLLDLTPVQTGLLAHEEPRRNTMARSHLNLHDGGVFGSTTDPYANQEFDTQFHDHDPRGWSDQQPWGEYRRLAESNLKRIDFKDDGDYSTTGGGVHPNTLYKNLRGAQNWTKARLKIFDTSFDGRSNGGVGVYAHTSGVNKSEYDLGMMAADGDYGDGMAMTYEDPLNRQRTTMRLSNLVHTGSQFLRTNDTTDHKVMVAGYGQIYKQRGMMNHESQMRQIEEDTQRLGMSRAGADGLAVAPKFKRVAILMANALEDRGGVNPKTAAAAARNLLQGAAEREEVLAGGMRGSEQAQGNREQMVAKDIMALLGFTTNEIKYLEKEALTNKKSAKRALADLHSMAEAIHKLPITEKFAMRDELLLKAAGGGLKPGSASGVANSKRAAVIINPKVLEHMGQKVRKAREFSKTGRVSKKKLAEASGQKLSRHEALFVGNSTNAATKLAKKGGLIKNKNAGGQRSAKAAKEAQSIASYRHLTYSGTANGSMAAGAQDSQFHAAAIGHMVRKGAAISDTDITEHFRAAAQDNDWGENKSFTRHGGRVGTKNTRRYIDNDGLTNDFANEIDTPTYSNQMVR